MRKLIALLLVSFVISIPLRIVATDKEMNFEDAYVVNSAKNMQEFSVSELPHQLIMRGPVTPDNPYPNNNHINYASGRDYVYRIDWNEVSDLLTVVADVSPSLKAKFMANGLNLVLHGLKPQTIYLTFTDYESVETSYTGQKWHIWDDITIYYGSMSASNIIYGPARGIWL